MKKIKTVLFLIFTLLILSYLGVVFIYYNDKFLPGTTINNIDVSLLTKQEALDKLNNEKITIIINEEKEYEYNINEFATINYNQTDIDNIFNIVNNKKMMLVHNKNYDIKPNVDINKDKLYSLIESQTNRVPSENAEIIFDNTFCIKNEIYGNELEKDLILEHLMNKIYNKEYNIDITNDFYKKPNVLKDDLTQQCENQNKYIDFNITLNVRGDIKEEINKEILTNWLVLDNTLKYDDLKIQQYVDELDEKYSTYGNSEEFITNSGTLITLQTDFYGWKIDKTATIENINEALNNQSTTTVDIVYEQEAVVAENNIGNTYLEVSIDAQHWWYYENGEIVLESDCVTGTKSIPSRNTDTGLTYVLNKYQDIMLQGDTWNTHVDYWIGINYDGEGLHDASWRSAFGGNIYLTDGSHGCVNTPRTKIIELYDLIEVNTPVIVY